MSHKQKSKALVIDGNNMLHRAYYKFSEMKAISGTPTGITYGFTYILKSLLTQFQPDKLYVVFDGGRAQQRKDLLPDYKRRDKKESFDATDFYRQRDITLEMLRCLGVNIIMKEDAEADDMIWLLIRNIKKRNNVTLVSSDKDFNQLLSSDVNIFNPGKKCLITIDNVKKLFGYEAHECVDYLILDGDASDNIKGYPGCGPKTAIKFLNTYKSIEEYLKAPPSVQFQKWERRKLEEVYMLNRQLIDLRLFVRKYLTTDDIKIINENINEIDLKELTFLCGENSIRTFTKPPFIKEFKNLLK